MRTGTVQRPDAILPDCRTASTPVQTGIGELQAQPDPSLEWDCDYARQFAQTVTPATSWLGAAITNDSRHCSWSPAFRNAEPPARSRSVASAAPRSPAQPWFDRHDQPGAEAGDILDHLGQVTRTVDQGIDLAAIRSVGDAQGGTSVSRSFAELVASEATYVRCHLVAVGTRPSPELLCGRSRDAEGSVGVPH